MSDAPTRRALLADAAVLSTLALAGAPSLIAAPAIAQGRRLIPTPPQTEGPYYPQTMPEDADADLLRFGARAAPEGTPALVSGRVLDCFGRPIAGAHVEIWQCDAHGRYHHVAARVRSAPA